MLLVKLIMRRKLRFSRNLAFTISATLFFIGAAAQDNSPYSRYGLGNLSPTTNMTNRGMGGVAAGYYDTYTVNYANPASYSFFQTTLEPNSNKLNTGRVVFNVGADGQSRTITDQSAQAKFTSPNILFSHIMLGVPLKKNWGMALGLRPMTSIDYKIQSLGKKINPNTGALIDSSATLYEGQGGVYLGSLGTAVKFKTGKSQYLSVGANAGYMFGSKNYNSRLSLFNDSTAYASANFENKTALSGFYFDAGAQYHIVVKEKYLVSLGTYGNWKQKINTNRNTVAETYTYNSSSGYIPIDTAYYTSDVKSNFIYPASITGGVIVQKVGGAANEAGWLVGADFTRNNWDKYRFEGQKDSSVKSNWQVKVGAEFRPAPKNSFLSRSAYRVGFFTGPDYIYAHRTKMPVLGVSAGIGLPVYNFSAQRNYQMSMLNLSFEYIKRGNNRNIIKENLYRVSVGFSLTDLWFGGKTKYYED